MPIVRLDHINVRTADVPSTLAFFRDVLQMTVVPPPGRRDVEEAGWVLDHSGHPAVHVVGANLPFPVHDAELAPASNGSGAIHHVAFDCTGFEEMQARLTSLGLTFTEHQIPQIPLRQIFVKEANGILIELNFRGA